MEGVEEDKDRVETAIVAVDRGENFADTGEFVE